MLQKLKKLKLPPPPSAIFAKIKGGGEEPQKNFLLRISLIKKNFPTLRAGSQGGILNGGYLQ